MSIKFNNDQKELSKFVSRVLRHEPWLYELEIDEEGWTPLEELIDVIHHARLEWQLITEQDLIETIMQSEKKRHEICDGKIRALYGHSIMQKIKKEITEPPELLFHGTSPKAIIHIREKGILPMKRQYVHLSTNKETAKEVGKRKSPHPIILTIFAKKAFQDNIKFYKGNDVVWLADFVPKKFIAEFI